MSILIQILQLLPTLISAVKAVEDAIPLSGKGKEKLETIIGIVTDTYGDVSTLIAPITKVISRIVGLFNSTGVFKKA